MSGKMPDDLIPCDIPSTGSKSIILLHNILVFIRAREWGLAKDYRDQLIEYTRELENENVELRKQIVQLEKTIVDNALSIKVTPMQPMPYQPEPVPWRHPIICPHCKRDTGYTSEGVSGLYMSDDLHCPHCNEIVIYVTKIICS